MANLKCACGCGATMLGFSVETYDPQTVTKTMRWYVSIDHYFKNRATNK